MESRTEASCNRAFRALTVFESRSQRDLLEAARRVWVPASSEGVKALAALPVVAAGAADAELQVAAPLPEAAAGLLAVVG